MVRLSCRHCAGEDGQARHPHSGPSPEAGAAVRGVGEAAHPEAQQRCAEDGREALPGRMDRQAAEDQPGSPYSHKVRPVMVIRSHRYEEIVSDYTAFEEKKNHL